MASIKHILSNRISDAWRVLRQSQEQRTSARRESASLHETVERVVDGTDARIRLVSGYRRKLQGAISTSLDYVNSMVDEIPGALEVSSRTFHSDPHVNAFFSNVDDLQTIFSHSSELRDFLEDHRNREVTETCALVCMQKTEQTVLGMELSGNMIKRDVQQTAVNFSDHRIYSPAASEPETRQCLRQCFFDGLVTTALAHIIQLRLSRHNLETRRLKLEARLRNLELLDGEQGTRQQSVIDNRNEADKIRKELAGIEGILERTRTLAVEDCLEEVVTVFRQPDSHVRLKKVPIKLNKMGIKIGASAREPGNDIELAEVAIGGEAPRVVMLAKFPKDELLPGTDFFEQARGHLQH